MSKKALNKYSIDFCIDYKSPLDLKDFTKSLNGISKQYKKFVSEEYKSSQPFNAKLHISSIKEGSILTTLVEYSDYTLPFLGEVNTILDFGNYLKTAYDYFLGKNNNENKIYDIEDLNNLSAIIQPGTNKENKTKIDVSGDNNNVVVLNINDSEASSISDKIHKEKKKLNRLDTGIYKKQAFYFYQAKKDVNSETGNYGVIEAINEQSLRVIFEDDKFDKKRMLKGNHNPLKTVFIVDVELQTVRGEPKIYKILKLHEIIEDD